MGPRPALTAAVGVDVGGTGTKGAIVDTATGRLLTDRHRVPTPQPAHPEAVVEAVVQLVSDLEWRTGFGCTLPAVIRDGVALTAANIDDRWIGYDAAAAFSAGHGAPVGVFNDTDAAGVAEMTLGAGEGVDGVVILLTLETGIGSALFVDGRLVPNTELGHLELDGSDTEMTVAPARRWAAGEDWDRWQAHMHRYLDHLDSLFSPDLMILAGGVSKHAALMAPLESRGNVTRAALANSAGIVGAALLGGERS